MLTSALSGAVVTITDEEGYIYFLARDQAMWLGDACAPRNFVKATCSAFRPELEGCWKRGEDCTRFELKIAQSRASAHHLGAAGLTCAFPNSYRWAL